MKLAILVASSQRQRSNVPGAARLIPESRDAHPVAAIRFSVRNAECAALTSLDDEKLAEKYRHLAERLSRAFTALPLAGDERHRMERPGGVRSYDLWRLGQINNVVGDYSIARAADAWSQFKRVRCGGLSTATVQRFRATFSAAINYLAAEAGFDAPKLPRGEKVSNKRVRYLTSEQAD